ncbi:asparaginase [Bartonella tamiae]|uniref:L-asparaginase, type II n=1 Tax=Bartonella tamiae Th239 TaxID=1094558 RepID=J0R5W3_9HYPH|nr:asparaginase [Bartonella tamiae]EJF91089.1 hypothetical protein ME5_00421 [Bartonella tamiae Th239]EJF93246.1 hypothetical protein MEG_01460 [Bartonella tamiae Th307]
MTHPIKSNTFVETEQNCQKPHLPKIAIGAMGGTIAMSGESSDGITPKLTAENLVKSVFGLSDIASIEAQTLAQLPSASITFSVLFDALSWANEKIDQGAKGVILTQGTDTLEESAFFLSLYWQRSEPLIVTGAMRSAQAAGVDGPANILASVQLILDDNSKNRGVLAVLNETIHAPYFLQKTHSVHIDAFHSSNIGPIGMIIEGQPNFFLKKTIRHSVMPRPQILQNNMPKIAIIETCLSSGSDQLKVILESGVFQGIVLSGVGSGHVSFEEAEILHKFAKTIPIVMASRAGTGPTTENTYGYKGGEIDLIKAGILMAGWLSPRKARLVLWAFLATGMKRDEIRSQWPYWKHFEHADV